MTAGMSSSVSSAWMGRRWCPVGSSTLVGCCQSTGSQGVWSLLTAAPYVRTARGAPDFQCFSDGSQRFASNVKLGVSSSEVIAS